MSNLNPTPIRPDETPLESWKEIAAYIQRNVVTARRWEKQEGLPIHRHSHQKGSSVYAYRSEIDTWRASRKAAPEPASVRQFWRVPVFALSTVLCLIMVGNGVRPAAAGQPGGIQVQQLTGPNLDADGSISADGRWMAITDRNTGDLAVRDMGSGKIKKLMATGSGDKSAGIAATPLISPDGKQLAYAWADFTDRKLQFRIMQNQPGAKPRILIQNSDATYIKGLAWSRDGRSVLTIVEKRDGNSDLAWVSRGDGSLTVIKQLGLRQFQGGSLSPDDRYILYSLTDGPTSIDSSVYIVGADGSSETVLAKKGVNEYPVWTPDGAYALFSSNRAGSFGLWAIPMQNGKASAAAKLLKGEIGRISVIGFASSGTLFYTHSEGVDNIYTVDVDPLSGKVSGAAVMLSESFVNSNGAGTWSPDGKSVAFLRNRFGGNIFDLVIHSIETGEENSFSSGQLSNTPPGLYWPSGSRQVLISTRDPRGQHVVFHRLDPRTGEVNVALQAEIGSVSSDLVFSPDAKTLYFDDYQDASHSVRELFSLDVTSGARKQVYKIPDGGQMKLGVLRVSPDGRALAFLLRRHQGAPWQLCTVSIDGSGFRELYTPDSGQVFTTRRTVEWSRDSRAILFAVDVNNGQDSRLMRISATGGKPEFTGLAMPRMHHVRLSPDGTHLSFGSRDEAKQEFWALHNLLPALKSRR